MKSLKNILARSLLGLALLSPAIPSEKIYAQEIQQEQTKNTSSWRKFVKFGFDWDTCGSSKYSKVEVPEKYIPQNPNEPPKDVEGKYVTHKATDSGYSALGPKIQLFSILEAGIGYNVNSEDDPNDLFKTYWGGYGQGQFACIGSVFKKQDPWTYSLTLQTPIIPLVKDDEFVLGLRAFGSHVTTEFDRFYKAGYHEWGEPFHTVKENFKIGDFKSEGMKYGLKVSGLVDNQFEFFFGVSYEKADIKCKPTEKGKDFKWDKNEDLWGFIFGFEF